MTCKSAPDDLPYRRKDFEPVCVYVDELKRDAWILAVAAGATAPGGHRLPGSVYQRLGNYEHLSDRGTKCYPTRTRAAVDLDRAFAADLVARRLAPLYAHLTKVGGRLLWAVDSKVEECIKQIRVECWLTDSNKTYLVRIWCDGSGWDVYGQLDQTNSVERTLEKIT
jgi:hypothetical protein